VFWPRVVGGGEAVTRVECPESPQNDDSKCTLGFRLDPFDVRSSCGLDLPEGPSFLSFSSSIDASSREMSDIPAPDDFRAGGMGGSGGRVGARSVGRCDLRLLASIKSCP
jgi:hypothetical protein